MKASTAETISMEKVVEKSSPSAMERSKLGTWFAGMDWGFVCWVRVVEGGGG